MIGRKPLVILGGVIAVLLLWFGGVDRVQYEEDCLDCQLGRTIYQTRLATAPVLEAIEERPSLLSMAAEDLGVPCPHDHVHRWLAERRLGLVLVIFEDHVLHPTQRPWYPPCAREAARSLAEAEPELPQEFRSRVISDHDWGFWTGLRERIFASCPPRQRPEAIFSPPLPDGGLGAPAEPEEASTPPEDPGPTGEQVGDPRAETGIPADEVD